VVRAPFDNEAAGLEERLAIVDGKSMDACDGSVGDGEFGPPVSRKEGASGE